MCPWSAPARDRKSTRLNSSHSQISYAVFCLKKKKNKFNITFARFGNCHSDSVSVTITSYACQDYRTPLPDAHAYYIASHSDGTACIIIQVHTHNQTMLNIKMNPLSNTIQ